MFGGESSQANYTLRRRNGACDEVQSENKFL